MLGLSYTGFIVPIPNVDEYNDFVTQLPLSPSLKRRLSTASRSSGSSSSSTQNELEHGNDNDEGFVWRRRRTGKGKLSRWRMSIGERVRSKRGRSKRGYVYI